ncbi:MAG: DUF4332 domain-containing protein [Chloroflexi bacterium]|nr:DUF4332 domain-containing protein [Chloroflexota bacterium]
MSRIVPPIEQLQRVPLLLLQRLERQGVFTTGLLLEVSETRTRRQTLADQIQVTTNDIHHWRDEALLLNLAGFGPEEQRMFTQAGITGLQELLGLDRETFGQRLERAARTLGMPAPDAVAVDGWYAQARTLEEE